MHWIDSPSTRPMSLTGLLRSNTLLRPTTQTVALSPDARRGQDLRTTRMIRHAATVLVASTSKTVAATAVQFRWLPVLLLVCLLSQVLLPHTARLKRRSVRSGARQKSGRDKSAESMTTETGATTATMTVGGETTSAAADCRMNAASLSAVMPCQHLLRHLSPHLLLLLLPPHTHTQVLLNLKDLYPATVRIPMRRTRHRSLLARPRQREVTPKDPATTSIVIRSAVVRSLRLPPRQLILTKSTVAALHRPRRRQSKAAVLPPTDMIATRTVHVTDADAATVQGLDLEVEMSVVNALRHLSLKLWPASTTLIRLISRNLLTSSTPTPQARVCRSSCLAKTSRLL